MLSPSLACWGAEKGMGTAVSYFSGAAVALQHSALNKLGAPSPVSSRAGGQVQMFLCLPYAPRPRRCCHCGRSVIYRGRRMGSPSSYLPSSLTTPWCPHSLLPPWVGNLQLGSRSTVFFSPFGRELDKWYQCSLPQACSGPFSSSHSFAVLPSRHGESVNVYPSGNEMSFPWSSGPR